MNAKASTSLIHRPYGIHHPYDPEPDERFPRDPVAGQPVTLGVKSTPSSGFDAVWVVWKVAGTELEHRIAGLLFEKTLEYDLWHIELVPFGPGEKILYRIFAQGPDSLEETDWFDFTVNQWVEYDHVISAEQDGSGLTIVLGNNENDSSIGLQIQAQETGTINLHLFQDVAQKELKHGSYREERTAFNLGDTQVELDPQSLQLTITNLQKSIVLKSDGLLRALLDGSGKIIRYFMAFNSPEKESFWGFGERFNALDQRGNSLRNVVIDQCKRQGKRTYYPVPFFISSRGYGVWINSDRDITFDMAESNSMAWKIDAVIGTDRGDLDLVIMPQGSPAGVVKEFTRLTGRPKMPPSWVFGLWMSSNDWNSQAEVMKQFDLTHQHNIPATVLVIEAWADEVNFYIWNDAQYDLKQGADGFKLSDFTFPKEGHWPDPKAMVEALHASGTRLILWQNPVVKHCLPEEHLDERQNRIDEQYLIENQLCAMEENGDPYRVLSPWFRGSLLIDFTNPKADEWWFKQREYLVKEMGVDGFKTDGGEHIWSDTATFSDGSKGKGRCNSFATMYLSAYDRFLASIRGKDRFLFSRVGYTGAQKFPGHWAGDEDSNWDAFRSNLRAMLNMSLGGDPFVGWDMAGFGDEPPTAELYLRSAAYSVFCPIMQYHSEYNARLVPSRDRTPWNIQERSGDQRVIPTFRNFAHLRMNLLPYLQYQAWLSCETGLPLLRALPFEYPDDSNCGGHPYEYLFGESLLAAPVVEEDKTEWEVYLPEGKWRDFWTHAEFSGARTMKVIVPLDQIPVYQREGSIVALNLDETFSLCSDVGNNTEEYRNLALRIYPGDGCKFDLVRDQGERIDQIMVHTDDELKTVRVELPELDCPVELTVYMNRPVDVWLNAGSVEWDWVEKECMVKIYLPTGCKRSIIELHKRN